MIVNRTLPGGSAGEEAEHHRLERADARRRGPRRGPGAAPSSGRGTAGTPAPRRESSSGGASRGSVGMPSGNAFRSTGQLAAPHAGRDAIGERAVGGTSSHGGKRSSPSVRSAANVCATSPVVSIHARGHLRPGRVAGRGRGGHLLGVRLLRGLQFGVEPAPPSSRGADVVRLLLGSRLGGALPADPVDLRRVFRLDAHHLGLVLLLLGLEERQVVLVGLLLLAGVPLGDAGALLGVLPRRVVVQEAARPRALGEVRAERLPAHDR